MKKTLLVAAAALIGFSASQAASDRLIKLPGNLKNASELVDGKTYLIYDASKITVGETGELGNNQSDVTAMRWADLHNGIWGNHDITPESEEYIFAYLYEWTAVANADGSWAFKHNGSKRSPEVNADKYIGYTANGNMSLSTTAKYFNITLDEDRDAWKVNSAENAASYWDGRGADGNYRMCSWNAVPNDNDRHWYKFFEITEDMYTLEHFDKPETSTAAAPKYYRIASNRAFSNRRYSDGYSNYKGVYLTIKGENQTAAALNQKTDVCKAEPGSYWWFEATDNGAVIMHNLVSNYALYSNGSNHVCMAEEGTPFYLINVTGKNDIAIKNTYAIAKSNPYGTDCLDQNNSESNGMYHAQCQWSPEGDANRGDYNNGSAWYFELATDAEVNAAKSQYLASIQSIYNASPIKAMQGYATAMSAMPSLFDNADAIKALSESETSTSQLIVETFPTEISEANTLLANVKLVQDDHSDLYYAAISAIGNKYMQLKGRRVANGYNNPFLTASAGTTDTNNGLSNDHVRSIWQIVPTETGNTYYLRNHATGQYLKQEKAGGKMKMTDTPESSYFVHVNTTAGGIGFTTDNNTGNDNSGLHIDALGNLVNWNVAETTEASWFDATAVDGEISVIATAGENEGEAILDFGDEVTLTPNATYADAHQLLISAVPTAENSEIATAAAVGTAVDRTEFSGSKLKVTGLIPGQYVVTAPAGYFTTAAGKLSKPVSTVFDVKEDGTTTGIDEVVAEGAASKTIFDLQGRRVSKASKGIFIINGKKTLVK